MQAYGSDRLRWSGEKAILQSPIPKGWRPRIPKTTTSAEHPGTAVQWEDGCYEVVSAEPLAGGGVRYVLAPWPDDAAMRHVERYDAESEAFRIEDHARALRQQRHSLMARLAGVFLGNLPASVQEHLGSELGVSPSRMTLLSAIPPVVLLGVCAYLIGGAMLEQESVPVPLWLLLGAVGLFVDAGIRYHVAMAQGRGMGSLPGVLLYTIVWALAPRRLALVSPFSARGQSTRSALPLPEEQRFADSLTMRAPLATLLSPADQLRLRKECGMNPWLHARPVTWILFLGSAAGVASLAIRVWREPRPTLLLSFVCALILMVDQIRRLSVMRQKVAGSILAPLVRPFFRDLLDPL